MNWVEMGIIVCEQSFTLPDATDLSGGEVGEVVLV